MDAIDLLLRDHRKARDIISSLRATFRNDEYSRKTLLQQLTDEVLTHAYIEEEVFYPQLLNYPETRAIVNEGIEEHHIVARLLKELEAIDSHDDNWQAKLHVLQDNLEHHMTEEEQKLFPKVRKLIGAARLGDMAKHIADLKELAVM